MTLAEELRSVAVLRGLGEPHVQKLAAIARLRECHAGDVLFHEGEDSPSIFIVLSGEVTLEVNMRDRGPTPIYAAGSGELLGWSPVLGRHALTATARAATPCRLAVLETAQVSTLIQQDPTFGVAFLRSIAMVVSDRLSATRRCLAALRERGSLPRFSVLSEGSD